MKLQTIVGNNVINHSEFGKRLQMLLSLEEPNRIIQGYGSFLQGGCLVLAQALEAIQPQLELWVTIRDTGTTDHVVVRFNHLFLDADGLGTMSDVLEKMQLIELINDTRILPVRMATLDPELKTDPQTVIDLANWLRPQLDFDQLRLETQLNSSSDIQRKGP